jgi:hypothetical protein
MEMEKVLLGGMAAMIGLAAVAGMAQASTPGREYVCPVCEARFATYDDLCHHFNTEHPAEPIEIIWE